MTRDEFLEIYPLADHKAIEFIDSNLFDKPIKYLDLWEVWNLKKEGIKNGSC